MAFDLEAIPAESRNRASIEAHVEIYNRTQDTIRVHNPTDTDFIVHNDRRFSNEVYSIPNKNKDIGFGKGNNDVPRFIARRFVDKLGMELINQKIKEDWDKKKKEFRLEERGVMEERLALRSNDPKLWDEVTKQLWVGVTKRYQSGVIEDIEPVAPKKTFTSQAEAALDRLEMADAEIGVPQDTEDTQDAKDTFADQIS